MSDGPFRRNNATSCAVIGGCSTNVYISYVSIIFHGQKLPNKVVKNCLWTRPRCLTSLCDKRWNPRSFKVLGLSVRVAESFHRRRSLSSREELFETTKTKKKKKKTWLNNAIVFVFCCHFFQFIVLRDSSSYASCRMRGVAYIFCSLSTISKTSISKYLYKFFRLNRLEWLLCIIKWHNFWFCLFKFYSPLSNTNI